VRFRNGLAAAALAVVVAGGPVVFGGPAGAIPDCDLLDDCFPDPEAMDALLLAAEAAAAATLAHQAGGRQGSARASRARARSLALRCDGARTPALRNLDADGATSRLTNREREVAELAALGSTNREIATTSAASR
jgi:hypothetical protein